MNWSDYVTNAVRTKSDQFAPHIVPTDVIHAIIGLATECGELLEALERDELKLDKINISEEFGDLLWYIAIYCNARNNMESAGIELRDYAVANEDITWCVNHITQYSLTLLDYVKKGLFYNRRFNWPYADALIAQIYALIATQVSVKSVCEVNIAKLRKRFPDKFTEAQANNRDLAAEREVLEAGDSAAATERFNDWRNRPSSDGAVTGRITRLGKDGKKIF